VSGDGLMSSLHALVGNIELYMYCLFMYPERNQGQPPQPFTIDDLFDEQFTVRHLDVTWLAGK